MVISKIAKMALFVMILMVVSAGSLAAEKTPVIKEFSSKGGHPQNKTGPADRMYLVRSGDKITFSVKADGAGKYEWTVNKKADAEATGNSFIWTVPNEKGIWEIHLKASDKEGEVHQEWVVSTLSKTEAPDFLDYFADGKFSDKRVEKDPWDRALKDWKANPKLEASRGFMRSAVDDVTGNSLGTNTAMSIACGTWKFRYRFPDGNNGQFGFGVRMSGKTPGGSNWGYGKCSDSHHHCWVGTKSGLGFSFEYGGTGWPEDGKWHQVTVIRTKDKWLYMYNDYIFEFYVNDRLDIPPSRLGIGLGRHKGHEIHIDNIEVYKDKYLFPETEVHYGKYTWNYRRNTTDHCYYPQTRNGIVVKGRGVRPADIARLLNDPSKFSYDEKTRKAVCNADLVIHDGAELSMRNETLVFNCRKDGERHFVLRYGAKFLLENSTITTAGRHYFVWNNAGSTTHFGRPNVGKRRDPIEFHKVGFTSYVFPLGHAGVIRFKANNSTINNAAHIFWDSPMELDITNMKFTNLRELDIGGYEGTAHYFAKNRVFAKGKKSFWVYTDEINTHKFNLKNVSFSGKDSPVNITFLINAVRDKLNVYDLNLKDENIVIRKSMPHFSPSHNWQGYLDVSYSEYAGREYPNPMGKKGSGIDSRLGLVNCKFKNLLVPTDKAWGIPKYYLDVKVVDKAGRSVRNAKVSVTNEVDNKNYPAENMDEKQPIFDPKPSTRNQYFFLTYRIIQGFANPSTVTGADGHIPLPTEKNRKSTVVLADYVQDKDGKKDFTYTITVEADGKKKVITGVDPGPQWYRPDAGKPTYTITAVLDGKTVTEEELKKGQK